MKTCCGSFHSLAGFQTVFFCMSYRKLLQKISERKESFLKMLLQICCFVLCLIFRFGQTMELEGSEEGSCKTLKNLPGHQDVDPVWLDSLPYVIGGSKFHLYRQASCHPRFRQLREYEFYYEACFVRNTSFIEGNGSIFGFGGVPVASYDVQPSSDRNALVDAFPSNAQTGSRSDFFRQRVSLTDYRTFAVMINCWVGADQKSWDVYSIVPRLDTATEQLIQDHIQSQGFKRENVVFLRYGNCQNFQIPKGNSLVGRVEKEEKKMKVNEQIKRAEISAETLRKGGTTSKYSQSTENAYQSGSIKRGIPSGGANTLKYAGGVPKAVTASTRRTTTTTTTTTTPAPLVHGGWTS